MPYSVVDKPSKYFHTVLYTGTTATQSITGVGFKPDWVWLKSRGEAQDHYLFDINRTATKALSSDLTLAEQTYTDSLTSFDSDGFTLGASTRVNKSTFTHVSWNWLGDNTTVSNTSGSITSTVSANTTSGFSIVSWTGSGANATVGHGLGVAPDFLIIKNRTGTNSWPVWSRSYGNAGVMFLDLQNTPPDTNSVFLNGTSPTSSVFSIGTAGHLNTSASNYIAYVFNSVKGYSKFGKYTGNGSADGTFVYTGFKPAMVIRKRTDANQDWLIHDNKRTGINQTTSYTSTLKPNDSTAELGFNEIDILSNGFKCRASDTHGNASGGTYIYMAFADNPFVSSKGIPTTAR